MSRAGRQHRILQVLLLGMVGAFAVAGILEDGPGAAVRGLLAIQMRPARLITDYVATDGAGAALLNGAVVGLLGILLTVISGVELSGPTFAAVFTMMGFALFGKTPANILPVILGVAVAARLARREFAEYLIIALFGTALGPLVSLITWEFGLTGIPALLAGTGTGVAVGLILPAIAVAMLHLHQGYNLYNIGLSCGFLALFAAAVTRACGPAVPGLMAWHGEAVPVLVWLTPVLSGVLLATGIGFGGLQSLKDAWAVQKLPGRLPTDFMDTVSMEGALVNAGFIGLGLFTYVQLVGGNLNGPVLGGLLTVMGFAAFGTHLRNAWPVVLGVTAAALLFGKPLSAAGAILAAIFCTTLAPLAGEFGVLAGLAAGFLHLVLVHQTGAWQGGINLYNNGFSGGLTATLIVSVIAWFRSERGEPSWDEDEE